MKTIQWVFIFFPLLCPNNGWIPIALITSAVGIWQSLHLNINVPYFFNTLKHSSIPPFITDCQFESNEPYLLQVHELSAKFTAWGGSNTTNSNDSSLNGRSVKSQTTSGFTTQSWCLLFFMYTVSTHFLLSQYNAIGQSFSNHIERFEQVTSRMCFPVVSIYLFIVFWRRKRKVL